MISYPPLPNKAFMLDSATRDLFTGPIDQGLLAVNQYGIPPTESPQIAGPSYHNQPCPGLLVSRLLANPLLN